MEMYTYRLNLARKLYFKSHVRTVRLFKPLPTSKLTGLIGYLGGSEAEYKNPMRAVALAENREGSRNLLSDQSCFKRLY